MDTRSHIWSVHPQTRGTINKRQMELNLGKKRLPLYIYGDSESLAKALKSLFSLPQTNSVGYDFLTTGRETCKGLNIILGHPDRYCAEYLNLL